METEAAQGAELCALCGERPATGELYRHRPDNSGRVEFAPVCMECVAARMTTGSQINLSFGGDGQVTMTGDLADL